MPNLPDFFAVNPKNFASELSHLLDEQRKEIESLMRIEHKTWNNFMRPLDDLDDNLEQFFSPLSHLHAVSNTKALREAYQASLPLLSDFATEIGQNEALFNAISSIQTANKIEEKIQKDEK